MELFANLGVGMHAALSPMNLLYCFVGVLLGTLVGVLPGLGPIATIAMLLPATFTLPPVSALIMLAGIFYGAQYGGSTTAILVNLPGETSSVITAMDGHQMALQGRAGPALATAAISSFVAGCLATALVAGFGPLLAHIFAKLGCELAPMLLGFILGPMMEEYLRRALLLSRGDPLIFVHRPLSAILLLGAILLLFAVLLPAFRKTREEAFQEAG